MAGSCKVSYNNKKHADTIWTQLWKTFMKRKPHGTDEVSKARRIPYRTTKKLRRSYKVNRNGTKKYEEAVWQKTEEPSRIKGWRQHVVGKQKYLLKQTLKEVGPKKIQTF